MKLKITSISLKLILLTGFCGLFIFGVLITYTFYNGSNWALKSSRENVRAVAREYSGQLKADIEKALNTARTIAQSLTAVKIPYSALDITRDHVIALLRIIVESNPSFLSTYTVWEPDSFDGIDEAYRNKEGYDDSGRFIPCWHKGRDGRLLLKPMHGYKSGKYYQIPKLSHEEVIIDPYAYPINGSKINLISLTAPIKYNGKFFGIAGVNIAQAWIQQRLENFRLNRGAMQIMLISHNGSLVADTWEPVLDHKIALSQSDLNRIKKGEEFDRFDQDYYLELFSPLTIGNTKTPWSVYIKIPADVITAAAFSLMKKQIMIVCFLSILMMVIVLLMIRRLLGPLEKMTEAAEKISKGDLEYMEVKTANDEIGRVNVSFTKIVRSLQKVTSVCQAIATGDFSRTLEIRSSKDTLGKAVNKMISDLKSANQEANRKISYLNNIPATVFTIDRHCNVCFINQAGAQMLNRTIEACIGYKCYVLFNTKHCNQGVCQTTLCMNTESVVSEDTFAQFSNQHTIPVRLTAAPLKDSNGKISGAIEYMVDITAEMKVVDMAETISKGDYSVKIAKRSEDDRLSMALNRMNATLRKMTQANTQQNMLKTGQMELGERIQGEQDLFTLTSGIISYLCEYLQAGVGGFFVLENEEIKLSGRYAFSKFSQQGSKTFNLGEGLVGQAVLEKKIITLTQAPHDYITISSGLGQACPDYIVVVPLLLEKKVKGVLELAKFTAFSDSELAFLEAAAQRIAIAVNSTQVRIKLDQAKHIIEEKARQLTLQSKYKSEFLANMSHELRTPLNSILILSNLMSENKSLNLTNKQVEYLKTIHASGSDLLGLINQILDISKVEAGKMEVNIDSTSLADIVENMRSNFLPVAQTKGIELVTHLSPELPSKIYTDQQKIEQIIKNFLSNAFKFTSQGCVGLKLERSDLEQANIAFRVTDTGIGIPSKKQDLIFEAFQQANGTTSREFGGTGLGLSISRELAGLLGGKIQLSSQAGQGSCFTLFLPEQKINQEINQKITPERSLIIEDDKNSIFYNRKILLVDDDMRNVYALTALLQERGLQVQVAKTGKQAVKLLSADTNIELVLMDGYEAMRAVRAIPDLKKIPIIALTAKAMKGDRDKCIQAGANDYLTKPVDNRKLLTMIRVWLSNKF